MQLPNSNWNYDHVAKLDFLTLITDNGWIENAVGDS